MTGIFTSFRFGGPTQGGGPAVGNPPDQSNAASPATAPSSRPGTGAPMGSTLIGTALDWITKALKPYSQQPPNALDESAIIPSLDVLNQGWALATYASGAIAFAQNTLSSLWNVIAKSASANAASFTGGDTVPFPQRGTFLARLIALDATHLGGAAPSNINIFLVPNATLFGASPSVLIATASVANAGGQVTASALLGSARDLLVPAGWDIEIQFPTTAAGESWVVHYAFACVPVGSRP